MTDQPKEMPNDLMKLTKKQLVDLIQNDDRRPPIQGEYPVSWHVEYKVDDFKQNLIIRGFTGAEVLGDAKSALEYLKNHAAQPFPGYYGKGKNGETQKTICPIHHVEMKQFSKNGRSWHSNRAINPDTSQEYWCNGKPQKEGEPL